MPKSNEMISNTFKRLLNDPDINQIFLRTFLDRFVYSTTDLESDIDREKRQKLISDILEAFNYLMALENGKNISK